MLESLNGLSRKETQGLLSSIALSLLPSPTSERQHKIDDAIYSRVLAETRERLNISPSDETADARSQVLDFLGNQISESVLHKADIAGIKSRLGENGDLRPDEYEIQLEPAFNKIISNRRVSEAEIFDVMLHPNEVEHLPSEKQPDDTLAGTSLYLKVFDNKGDRYALLIGSDRSGHTQSPQFVWRIFFSDVDIQSAYSPLEVLRNFANYYGLRFQIGSLPPSKFYVRQLVPAQSNMPPQGRLSLRKFVRIMDYCQEYLVCMTYRYSRLGFVSFGIAFMIDLDRYRKDLERHGIKIATQDEILSNADLDIIAFQRRTGLTFKEKTED